MTHWIGHLGVRPEAANSWFELPDLVVFNDHWLHTQKPGSLAMIYQHQLASSLRHLGCNVECRRISDKTVGLQTRMLIDERPCVLDIYENGALVDWAFQDDVELALCLVALPHLDAYTKHCPMPTIGWVDWQEALHMRELRDRKPTPRRDVVACMGLTRGGRGKLRLNARRLAMCRLLEDAFGDRAQTGWRPRRAYTPLFANALIACHMGGAFAGSWDRTTAQAFSLGIPLVQPEIIPIVGWERPAPGVHYLACRPDAADVVEKTQALLDDTALRERIGAAARQFYDDNVAPEAAWRRVTYYLRGEYTPPAI